MTVINEKFTVNTQGFTDIIDITQKVKNAVYSHSLQSAVVHVYVAGSTVSITNIEFGIGGIVGNIRTSNGLIAEIQVNTERMIYAKEKPDDAKKILGEKRWNEIRKQTGMEGGLGHKYYEEWREKDRASDEAQNIAQKSVEYYNHFR